MAVISVQKVYPNIRQLMKIFKANGSFPCPDSYNFTNVL